MAFDFVGDLEFDLMSFCLKKKGRWWANHFFRNREVNELYAWLRQKSLGDVR